MPALSALFNYFGLDPKTTAVLLAVAAAAVVTLKYARRAVNHIDLYILRALTFRVTNALHLAVATRFSLADYATRSLSSETTRFLHVPGNLDKGILVDECFVPLRLLDSSTDNLLDHSDLISAGTQLCVIGDPGSGKSTIVKRIFRDECAKGARKAQAARMPVMLNLRDVPIPKTVSPAAAATLLTKAIALLIGISSAFEIQKCYDIYLRSTGLLILLDGLDEVASKDYRHFVVAIKHLSQILAAASDRNILIITMRTQFYRQVSRDLFEVFPLCYEVKPFAPTDIYNFLTKWPFKDDKRENILRIYNRLNDLPTLRDMCSNPLILSMYVAEDETAGHAPHIESRTSFYRKVVDELLYRRRSMQLAGTRVPQKIREQRQHLLGKVAYEHMIDTTQSANHLSWPQLIKNAAKEFKCSREEATAIVWEISKETGLFTEEQKDESFRFIHLTFCEFLAAFYVVEAGGNEFLKLINHHKELIKSELIPERTRLNEVVPFCCGLLPVHSRRSAIVSVISIDDFRLQILAFLESKYYDEEYWERFKIEIQKHLIDTLSGKNESWLQLFRIFAVVLGDAEQSSIVRESSAEASALRAFFAQASEQGRDVVARLVLDYMQYDGPAAVDIANLLGIDLVSVGKEVIIRNCDQPALLAVVCKMAAESPQDISDWTAILAEAAIRSPAAAENLRSVASLSILDKERVSLPRRALWYDPVVARRDLLTDCISVSLSRNRSIDETVYPMLALVSRLPYPRKMLKYFVLQRWFGATSVVQGYLVATGMFAGLNIIGDKLRPFGEFRILGINLNIFNMLAADKYYGQARMHGGLLMILAGSMLLASILYSMKPKAYFLSCLYSSIVHRPSGRTSGRSFRVYFLLEELDGAITAGTVVIRLPHFVALVLPSFVQVWLKEVYLGRAVYAALMASFASDRARMLISLMPKHLVFVFSRRAEPVEMVEMGPQSLVS